MVLSLKTASSDVKNAYKLLEKSNCYNGLLGVFLKILHPIFMIFIQSKTVKYTIRGATFSLMKLPTLKKTFFNYSEVSLLLLYTAHEEVWLQNWGNWRMSQCFRRGDNWKWRIKTTYRLRYWLWGQLSINPMIVSKIFRRICIVPNKVIFWTFDFGYFGKVWMRFISFLLTSASTQMTTGIMCILQRDRLLARITICSLRFLIVFLIP